MEIILLESLDKLGKIGDVVKVKDGFARNYLLPQKKALRANEENKKYYESIKTEIKQKNQKLIENAKAISNNLSKKEIVFIRQASDTGQLYGSVSPKDISNKLAEDKYDIQPSKINLSSAIKNIGIFDIIIKLHAEVSFNITLNVATSDENAKLQKNELLNEKNIIKSPEKPEVDKKLGNDSAIEKQELESSHSNKKDKTNSDDSIKKAKSKKKTKDKSEININTSSNKKKSDEKQAEESEITSTKVEDEKKK